MTENCHYNTKLDVGVNAMLRVQGLVETKYIIWEETHRFRISISQSYRKRYSVNELELLGGFWSIDFFKYYLYSKYFTVITHHREHYYQYSKNIVQRNPKDSGLSRWIDWLIPYKFAIEHTPGAKMVLVGHISRNLFAKTNMLSNASKK